MEQPLLTKFIIRKSKIHGNGIFASQLICQEDFIGIAARQVNNEYEITPEFGAFVNHSINANSCLMKQGNNYNLIAIKEIKAGEEIVADYNLTPYFIEKPGDTFI